MSSIHFKFKSGLEYETITFDGPGISLADLRESIVAKKKIARSTDYTLEITNAQNKQVYNDESLLIPKNTSVIIKRVPIKRATSAAKSQLDDKLNESISLEKLSKTADLANAVASEQDKIKAMMSQSAEEWQPSQYVRKSVPHARYTCFKCGQQGHYIKDCPTSGPVDKSMFVHKRSRNAGIPKDYVPPIVVKESSHLKQDNTRSYSPVVSSDVVDPTKVPPELQCPMCAQLFTDAVVVPCCGTSYCDECIRNHLLENDLTCPSCQETTSPDNLIANKLLRTSCSNFRNRRKTPSSTNPSIPNNNNAVTAQIPPEIIKSVQPPAVVVTADPVVAPVNRVQNNSTPKPALSPLNPTEFAVKDGMADIIRKSPKAESNDSTPSGSSSSRSSSSGSSSDGSESGSEATPTSESAPLTSTTSTAVTTSKPINADIAKAIHADIAALGRDTLLPPTSRSVTSLHGGQRLPPIAAAPGYPPTSVPLVPHPTLQHPSALQLLDPLFHPVHPALMHENPYLPGHIVDPTALHLGGMDPFYDMEGGAGVPLSVEEFYRTQELLHNKHRHRDERHHDDRHRSGSSERLPRHRSSRTYKHSGSDYEYRSSRSDRSERKHHSSSSHSHRRSPMYSDDGKHVRSGRSRSPRYRKGDSTSRSSRKDRSLSPRVEKRSKKVRSASPLIKSTSKSESSDDLRNQISASKKSRARKDEKTNESIVSSHQQKSENYLEDRSEKHSYSDSEARRKRDKLSSKREKSKLADEKHANDENHQKQRRNRDVNQKLEKRDNENATNDDEVRQRKDDERRKRKHNDVAQKIVKVKRRSESRSEIIVANKIDTEHDKNDNNRANETKALSGNSDKLLSNDDDNKTLVKSAVRPVHPDGTHRRESVASPCSVSDDEHTGGAFSRDQSPSRLESDSKEAIVSTEASPSLLLDNDSNPEDDDVISKAMEKKSKSKHSKKKKKHKRKHKKKGQSNGGSDDLEGAQSDGINDDERSKRKHKHKKHKRKHYKNEDNENELNTRKTRD